MLRFFDLCSICGQPSSDQNSFFGHKTKYNVPGRMVHGSMYCFSSFALNCGLIYSTECCRNLLTGAAAIMCRFWARHPFGFRLRLLLGYDVVEIISRLSNCSARVRQPRCTGLQPCSDSYYNYWIDNRSIKIQFWHFLYYVGSLHTATHWLILFCFSSFNCLSTV